ncbi:DUF3501 family protein [Emcibacter sp. SYSU 3D8]|uniref:DUF3501 family protein n=1 Tax=Emcibacter sp. SYSU 3D8 TaxID=3133969 RepID=UPI0031FF0E55
MTKQITRADILPTAEYGAIRKQKRSELVAKKRHRRVEVGPHVTFYFESYETMWLQIHEMLFIEKGGEAQVDDELAAYNPLIPQGSELIATMMFEIDDENRRKRVLGRLGGVEQTVTITIGSHVVRATAEEDVDRTTAEGKTSSVHFLRFPFTPEQIAAFRDLSQPAILGIGHEGYQHMAMLSADTRNALASDFDV